MSPSHSRVIYIIWKVLCNGELRGSLSLAVSRKVLQTNSLWKKHHNSIIVFFLVDFFEFTQSLNINREEGEGKKIETVPCFQHWLPVRVNGLKCPKIEPPEMVFRILGCVYFSTLCLWKGTVQTWLFNYLTSCNQVVTWFVKNIQCKESSRWSALRWSLCSTQV